MNWEENIYQKISDGHRAGTELYGTVWNGMKQSETVGHGMVTFSVINERFTVFCR